MFLSMVGVRVLAYGTEIDGIYYEFHEFRNGVRNVACVSSGRNKVGEVTIPSSVIYHSTSYTGSWGQALDPDLGQCSCPHDPGRLSRVEKTAFSGMVKLRCVV